MAQLGGQSSTSSMFKMLETSPSKRNKRKSAEPMKRLSSNSEQDIIDNQKGEHRLPLATQFKNYSNSLQTSTGQNDKCYYKRPKLEQTSDGEDHHTSPSPRLSSRYVLFKLHIALVVYDRNHLFGLGSDTETETENWPKLLADTETKVAFNSVVTIHILTFLKEH